MYITIYCNIIFMQVIWVRLFSKKSSSEKGTLYQLKNALHRTNVPLDPASNMKAAEDFYFLFYMHTLQQLLKPYWK